MLSEMVKILVLALMVSLLLEELAVAIHHIWIEPIFILIFHLEYVLVKTFMSIVYNS